MNKSIIKYEYDNITPIDNNSKNISCNISEEQVSNLYLNLYKWIDSVCEDEIDTSICDVIFNPLITFLRYYKDEMNRNSPKKKYFLMNLKELLNQLDYIAYYVPFFNNTYDSYERYNGYIMKILWGNYIRNGYWFEDRIKHTNSQNLEEQLKRRFQSFTDNIDNILPKNQHEWVRMYSWIQNKLNQLDSNQLNDKHDPHYKYCFDEFRNKRLSKYLDICNDTNNIMRMFMIQQRWFKISQLVEIISEIIGFKIRCNKESIYHNICEDLIRSLAFREWDRV